MISIPILQPSLFYYFNNVNVPLTWTSLNPNIGISGMEPFGNMVITGNGFISNGINFIVIKDSHGVVSSTPSFIVASNIEIDIPITNPWPAVGSYTFYYSSNGGVTTGSTDLVLSIIPDGVTWTNITPNIVPVTSSMNYKFTVTGSGFTALNLYIGDFILDDGVDSVIHVTAGEDDSDTQWTLYFSPLLPNKTYTLKYNLVSYDSKYISTGLTVTTIGPLTWTGINPTDATVSGVKYDYFFTGSNFSYIDQPNFSIRFNNQTGSIITIPYNGIEFLSDIEIYTLNLINFTNTGSYITEYSQDGSNWIGTGLTPITVTP